MKVSVNSSGGSNFGKEKERTEEGECVEHLTGIYSLNTSATVAYTVKLHIVKLLKKVSESDIRN